MAETTEKSILIDINLKADDSIAETLRLKDALTLLYEQREKIEKTSGRNSKAYEVNAAAIRNTSEEIRNYEKVTQKAIQAQSIENDTIQKTKLALYLVTDAWNKQKKISGENSKEVLDLVKQKEFLIETLKREEQATGVYTRSVGDYKQATIGLTDQLKGMIYELSEMASKGQTNTIVFQNLQREAEVTKEKINDLKDQTIIYSREVGKIEGVISIVSGLQTAVEGVQGAMKLMGVENKDLNKAVEKLGQVMAVLNSINAIAQLLDEKSIAIGFIKNIQLKAGIVATNLQTAAEGRGIVVKYAAATAQKVLNFVMSANPIGLLIAAVTALAGAFYFLMGRTQSLIEIQKANNEIQKANIDLTIKLYELKTSTIEKSIAQDEIAIEKAKERGASEIEILKMELAIIEKRKTAHEENAAAFDKDIASLSRNKTALSKLYKDEEAQIIKISNLNKNNKTSDAENETKRLERIQAEISNAKSLIDNAIKIETEKTEITKSEIAKRKEITDKQLEEAVKAMELDLSIEIAKQKELDETNILQEKYYNEQKTRIKNTAASQLEIANVKLKDKELELAKLNITNKMNADLKALETIRIQALVKFADIELENWKLLNKSKLDEKKAWMNAEVAAEKERLLNEFLITKKAIEDNGKLQEKSELEITNEKIKLHEDYQKNIKAIDEKYIDKQKELKEYENNLKAAIVESGSLAEIKAKQEKLKYDYDIEKKALDEKYKQHEKYNELLLLLDQKYKKDSEQLEDDKLDFIFGKAGEYLQMSQTINSTLSDLNNANNELQLTNIQKGAQDQIDEQKRLLDTKVINQKEYEAKVKSIEKKAENESLELQRKQASNNKKLAIADTIINTLVSSINVFKSLSSIPYVGYVLGAAAAAATLATGFLTVQKIKNTPLPGGGGGESGGGDVPTISNNTPSNIGYSAPQNVNSGIMSKQTVIDNTKVSNTNTAAVIVDEVTAKQNKIKSADSLATI